MSKRVIGTVTDKQIRFLESVKKSAKDILELDIDGFLMEIAIEKTDTTYFVGLGDLTRKSLALMIRDFLRRVAEKFPVESHLAIFVEQADQLLKETKKEPRTNL